MNNLLQQLQQHAAVLPPSVQAELLNYAIYLEQQVKTHRAMEVSEPTRRQRLAEALEEAAMLDPYRAIEDPVAWQHEQRQDRALPGRDHAD